MPKQTQLKTSKQTKFNTTVSRLKDKLLKPQKTHTINHANHIKIITQIKSCTTQNSFHK
jgi:hypothetical protein